MKIARYISSRLIELDVMVYFDENYESEYLGKRLSQEFQEVFASKSRFVVCLLDKNHHRKIWPTFERDVFTPRVKKGEVIPIFLDDTKFPGIPDDLYGIKFLIDLNKEGWQEKADNEIILKLVDKIG